MRSRDQWRAWLETHHATAQEVWLIHYKKHTDKPGLTYEEAVEKVVPNRLIEYRTLFPLSLLAPGNRFIIEPKGPDTCTFTATGGLRMPEWLFRRMHRKHARKIEATRQHMREEGLNLKRALEQSNGRA